MAERPTGKRCRYCGGMIVEKIVKKFDSTTGPMIIGPGSKNQFRKVSKGLHCQSCGLKYEFISRVN